MKRVMLILSCLFISIGFITAQTTRVTGIVLDDIGEPVVGASVVVKGTTIGTITDVDGAFSISVPEGKGVLVFSLVGMQLVEARVTPNMKVTMKSDETVLDEVIVTGYGVTKKLLLREPHLLWDKLILNPVTMLTLSKLWMVQFQDFK